MKSLKALSNRIQGKVRPSYVGTAQGNNFGQGSGEVKANSFGIYYTWSGASATVHKLLQFSVIGMGFGGEFK